MAHDHQVGGGRLHVGLVKAFGGDVVSLADTDVRDDLVLFIGDVDGVFREEIGRGLDETRTLVVRRRGEESLVVDGQPARVGIVDVRLERFRQFLLIESEEQVVEHLGDAQDRSRGGELQGLGGHQVDDLLRIGQRIVGLLGPEAGAGQQHRHGVVVQPGAAVVVEFALRGVARTEEAVGRGRGVGGVDLNVERFEQVAGLHQVADRLFHEFPVRDRRVDRRRIGLDVGDVASVGIDLHRRSEQAHQVEVHHGADGVGFAEDRIAVDLFVGEESVVGLLGVRDQVVGLGDDLVTGAPGRGGERRGLLGLVFQIVHLGIGLVVAGGVDGVVTRPHVGHAPREFLAVEREIRHLAVEAVDDFVVAGGVLVEVRIGDFVFGLYFQPLLAGRGHRCGEEKRSEIYLSCFHDSRIF